MSTTSASLPRARRSPRTFAKPTLWLIAALAGISVLLYTEYPLFFNHPRNPHGTLLLREWFILFPHALAGVLATVIGPFQFSTRMRQRHLRLHRLLGKVYVVCICVAAPLVIVLSLPAPPLMRFAGEITGPLWLLCTLAAFLTARNRQIQAHRQWMIRSYAFTLNFIIARVLNPLPAYAGMSDDAFAMTLMFFAILYLFIPDIYFSWRELTTKRRT
jgi:uncharacterized membrane protein